MRPNERLTRHLFVCLLALAPAGRSSLANDPVNPPEGISPGGRRSILQQIAESEFEAQPATVAGPRATWRLTNRPQALEARFATGGVSVGPRGNDAAGWSWGLTLAGFGPAGAAVPVAPADPLAAGNRVEYRRPGLTEWYVNDRRGVEQGFTILESPAGSPDRIELLLALSGSLTPLLGIDPDGLTLRDAAGDTVLGYSGLHAFDAAGRTLTARMNLPTAGGAQLLRIEVDVAGAAFPVVVDPLISTQVQRLTAADAAANDEFGFSVSISGDTVVVGAYRNDDAGSASGSAYVFERNVGGVDSWGQVMKLTAADAAAGDSFGISASISGDRIVVGAYGNNDAGPLSGSAYVFERNVGGADNWGQVKKLAAADAAAGDSFGWSVSISGDTVVVGAYQNDVAGSASGSAYVFERNFGGADNWGQVKRLIAADAAAVDLFGYALSLSGDTVVVGAYADDDTGSNSGSAYVFERNAGGSDRWGQVQKLTAADGAADDNFGISVSISGDTLVVGAYTDDSPALGSGSAYVFERNAGSVDDWGQVQKLTAADGSAGDTFGVSVSISGDTVVVGAYLDDLHDTTDLSTGSAYVFERNAGGADNWGQVHKLIAADAVEGDNFGISVAISGDTVVVGAYRDDDAGSSSGSAYTFTITGCEWNEFAKPVAADAAVGDFFGNSVSISGDTAVVGAFRDDGDRGSAYVLARNVGGADHWGQIKKLTAADAAVGDFFGWSVSISGDTLVVGALFNDDAGTSSGSAYVFGRNAGGPDNWGQVKKLTAVFADAGDRFGNSVSISGDTVVVGAYHDEDEGSASGAAYRFERNWGGTDNWGQAQKLFPADAAEGDVFGTSVSISGDTVVVGAPQGDAAGSFSGSAYVFARNQVAADIWGQVQKLTAADAAAGDVFGYSVSISGDTVVVGAPQDDAAGSFSGSAYVFERNAGGADDWGQVQKLTAMDAATGDFFGYSVSITGDTVVAGAYRDDDAGVASGSAYVFERNAGGADDWGQVQKLSAADAAANDELGVSVSISGDTVVVGADGNDDAGSSSGSAYVFSFTCPICGDALTEIPEECDDGNTVGGDECAADCSVLATGVPDEASADGEMLAARTGSSIDVEFAPACAATDHAAYWGYGPIEGALNWAGSACDLGVSGATSFDPGSLLPGEWLYFVVVGYDGDDEGGYGADSSLTQRPEAVGVGACDRPAGPPDCE